MLYLKFNDFRLRLLQALRKNQRFTYLMLRFDVLPLLPFLVDVATPKHRRNDLVYVAAATRKRQVASECLLYTHSIFDQQVIDDVRGCVQVVVNWPDFYLFWREDQWRILLLSQAAR